MYKKIKELTNISSGYTFRGSIKNDSKGNIFVIQAKNIYANKDIINIDGFSTILDDSIRNPFFLEYNDILLVSRGSGFNSFRSAVFTSNIKNVMPSSSVHVIRVKDVNIIPKYLSLYLNSDIGQKSLYQIVTGGAYIQSMLIKDLNELEIPIPPINTQKSIIAIHENAAKQELLYTRKQEIQKNIINSIFINLTK